MNKTQATRLLRQALGKRAGYQLYPNAPDAAGRLEAHAQAKAAAVRYQDAKADRDARRRVLLDDPLYRELCAKATTTEHEHAKALALTNHYRIEVGTISTLGGFQMFDVRAYGDSWAEVIDMLDAKTSSTTAAR